MIRRYQPKTVSYDRLKPTLRTAMPESRLSNQIETLLPMIKRNQNIPDIGGDVDDGVLADLMIDKFIGTYIPVSSRGWFDSFEHSKILPN